MNSTVQHSAKQYHTVQHGHSAVPGISGALETYESGSVPGRGRQLQNLPCAGVSDGQAKGSFRDSALWRRHWNPRPCPLFPSQGTNSTAVCCPALYSSCQSLSGILLPDPCSFLEDFRGEGPQLCLCGGEEVGEEGKEEEGKEG